METDMIGKRCKIGAEEFTIIGYIWWNHKLQYIWVKSDTGEERRISPRKVTLL